MQYRELGRTGWKVSSVSFGSWAIGGTWGAVEDAESLAALHRAVELGVNFFDTADVYGDGEHPTRAAAVERFNAPHLVFLPGIAIMLTVLAFNLIGDGLRDALDPRLKRR